MDKIERTLDLIASDKSVEELIVALGDNASGLGFDELTDAQKSIEGSKWWTRHSAEIKKLICSKAGSSEVTDTLTKDLVQLAFGVLGAKYGAGIATYAVAIAIRHVIDGWCETP
ncbi:MAG: hypothetical protein AAGC84_07000 [Pseudomonas sp.]